MRDSTTSSNKCWDHTTVIVTHPGANAGPSRLTFLIIKSLANKGFCPLNTRDFLRL
ncbi:protein of unknown function [Pararobbsia alpina]